MKQPLPPQAIDAMKDFVEVGECLDALAELAGSQIPMESPQYLTLLRVVEQRYLQTKEHFITSMRTNVIPLRR